MRPSPMPITGAIGPCSKQVGRAVVVHPKGRLLRLARERGWDVVRPRKPVPHPGSTPMATGSTFRKALI